jgi:histidinol-phosphate/aromatic aminotransferase/cobyric acid decarboxylase-like protein
MCCFVPQKLESDMARWQEEIPADTAAAEAAGAALEAAEAHLEELQEGIKDEVEGHHQALNKVGGFVIFEKPGCWCRWVWGGGRGGGPPPVIE